MKICTCCKIEKPFEFFHKDKKSIDGYNIYCRDCKNTKTREWKAKNKEKISEYNTRRYYEDQEYHKERSRKYHSENRDAINKKVRIKYSTDLEDSRKKNRKRYLNRDMSKVKIGNKKYRLKHKAKVAITKRKWRENNPEKISEYRATYRSKRQKATPRWLTKSQREDIQEFYLIAIAFRLYTGLEYHVDHIIPLNNKKVCGLHVPWNLQVLEASENIRKNNKF